MLVVIQTWAELLKGAKIFWPGFQNNDEKGITYHHSQKMDFLSKFVCVHSQTVALCSCSYLARSSCKEEVGVFVNISCLTQKKQKHFGYKQLL